MAIVQVKELLRQSNAFALRSITKKQTHIIRFDIDDYFDTIDRNILNSLIKNVISDFEICRLIDLCVSMGVVSKNNKWQEKKIGVPQGAVLSPLLSNLYLDQLDKYFESNATIFVRYADDFVVLCDSESATNKTAKNVKVFLNDKLKIHLNPTKIVSIDQGVEFLGIVVQKNNKLSVSKEKLNSITNKFNSITLQNGVLTEKSIKSIDGIKNYYGQLLSDAILETWDAKLLTSIEKLLLDNKISNKNIIQNILSVSLLTDINRLNRQPLAFEISEKIRNQLEDVAIETNRKIIASRKLEYRKREGDSLDLVINTYGHSVGLHNNSVIVKKTGKKVLRLGANLRHITILSEGVSISSNLIVHCAEKGIPIDFFNNKFQHICTLASERFMHCSHWESQLRMDIASKHNLGKRIISGKIKNQANLVKYFNKYHKNNYDLYRCFNTTIERLNSILNSIKDADLSLADKYQDTLQSFEAQAAIHYWEYIRNLLSNDDVKFIAREHQGATDIMNSMLNYGYALIYPRVWQAILACKLNPYMGIIHYQKGKSALLFDIIELFRSQAVDRVVISLIQKREPLEMNGHLLSDSTKRLLSKNIFERLYRYEKYRGKDMRFDQIIKQQVSEIVDYIVEGKNYRPYIAKW